MQTSGLIVITAFALALVPSGLGAESVAWGSEVNGLRLGVAFGSDSSKPTLRVVFENVSSDFEEVLVGHRAGSPIYDSLNFTATALDEKKRVGLHKSVFTPTAGLVLPFFVLLGAGETHELEFPLTDIIYASGTTATLEMLVKQGYSVRVQFVVDQRTADSADLSRPWIGLLSTAKILPTH